MIASHHSTVGVQAARLFRALSRFWVVLIVAGNSARAAHPPAPARAVLVELFTSQGCSSCPRADAFVSELAQLGYGPERAIPLTFHVGYWDGLGWIDPFSQPEFDQRQDRYARSFDGPYTPQMVIDGRVSLVGSRRSEALTAIDRWRTEAAVIVLSGTAQRQIGADSIEVQVEARRVAGRPAIAADAELFAALYEKVVTTAVAGGENNGRTLRESFVVRQLAGPRVVRARDLSGRASFLLAIPAGVKISNLGIAVFAQQRGGTVVFGSSQIPLLP